MSWYIKFDSRKQQQISTPEEEHQENLESNLS